MAITLNYCLDTRAVKGTPPGNVEFPIKLTITKNGSTAYLATGIKVIPSCWKDRKVTGRKDKGQLNDFLDSFKSDVRHIINDNHEKYCEMTATAIKNNVAKVRGGEISLSPLFIPYLEDFAEQRTSERTREIYHATAHKIKILVKHSERLRLKDITLDWLENFDKLLIARGNHNSTRSLEFRNIRAVIKYAYKHKVITENPFELFKVPTPDEPLQALKVKEMKAFLHAEVKPSEQKYYDFFLLSFFLCGIGTADLMNLRCIEDGRINYCRVKTGVPNSIKVENEAMEIIQRYPGKNYLIDVHDKYQKPKNWTSKVDKALKDIAKRNGLPQGLSMYWSRHTWATICGGDLRFGDTVVSDGLAHKPPKKSTSGYIERKDYSLLDEANRKVIDYLLSPED
jgi:site-specific recombinase XerD